MNKIIGIIFLCCFTVIIYLYSFDKYIIEGTSINKEMPINEGAFIYEVKSTEKDEINQLYNFYPNLSSNLKDKIWDLNLEWKKFRDSMNGGVDPTEDFKESEFIYKLKDFFGDKESVEITPTELGRFTDQSDIIYKEKKFKFKEKEYNLRIIGYNADIYVEVLYSRPLKSKWIFLQYWNDNEFYFTTLTDGEYFYFDDFLTIESNDKLNFVIATSNMGHSQRAVRLYALEFTEKGLQKDIMFDTVYKNDFGWQIRGDGTYIDIEYNYEDSSKMLSRINSTLDQDNNLIKVYKYCNESGEYQQIELKFENGGISIK